jgi:hypothetical protein
MIIIIHTGRKSLLSHLERYFKTFVSTNTRVVKINSVNDVNKYEKSIKNGSIKYFVFSNGTDTIDQKIASRILSINPNQELIFSENAWLTWQDFLYLDPMGIGNNSDIYEMKYEDMPNVYIPTKLRLMVNSKVNSRLSVGTECTHENYVMVPLQVNNDSKLTIGSPYFKRVEEFVDYIVKLVPNDTKILFKNHPDNKNLIPIPRLPNVIDVTNLGFSKSSLIKKSIIVAGINSTFLMESIFMNHKTVTFGLDLFSNKDITIDGYGKSFDDIMKSNIDYKKCERFVELLISRQIPKTHTIDEYKKTIINEQFTTPCGSF